ncbi:MAG: hypothetical protein OEW58_00510 [Gammaproteobacteria bacterium]|nr:hypothetical protein [Gammaproteobacteria bacterium]
MTKLGDTRHGGMFFMFLLRILVLMWLTTAALADEVITIDASSGSSRLVTLFFEHFAKQDQAEGYQFNVIVALPEQSQETMFTVRHHSLGGAGSKVEKTEILLAKAPIAIVVGGKTGVKKLSIGDLARLYRRKVNNWSQLGGANHAIVLAGRQDDEQIYSEIKRHHSFMSDANFDKVLVSGQAMREFIESEDGNYAVGFGSREDFSPKHLVEMYGFTAGVDVGLVYDKKHADTALIKAISRYAKSAEWRQTLMAHKFYPVL